MAVCLMDVPFLPHHGMDRLVGRVLNQALNSVPTKPSQPSQPSRPSTAPTRTTGFPADISETKAAYIIHAGVCSLRIRARMH